MIALHRHNLVIVYKQHAFALCAVGSNDGVVRIQTKESNLSWAFVSHGRHDGVSGVEHRRAGLGNVLHNDALQDRKVFHRGDVIQTQVVAHADVGDHSHLAAIKRQAFAQHAAACSF